MSRDTATLQQRRGFDDLVSTLPLTLDTAGLQDIEEQAFATASHKSVESD